MNRFLRIKTFSLFFSLFALVNNSSAQIAGSGSTLSVTPSTTTIVDPNITVGGSDSVKNFTVQITSNYFAGDVLWFDTSVARPLGITGAYTTTTASGILTFTGTSTPANWQTLLRTVSYKDTAAACGPSSRGITFMEGQYIYASFNNHFYTVVHTPASWTNAKAAADASTYNGLQGYLATCSSAAENNFLWKLLSADAWIGASYDYNEINAAVGSTVYANQAAAIGNVFWVTGPEKGTFISSGLSTPVAQNGQYINWNSGEPNNSLSANEFAIELYSTNNGQWNDFTPASLLPYIIEYGGMAGDVPASNSFTRNLAVTATVGGDISGGNISVCSGNNNTVLTTSAAVPGVSILRWESSLDNFLTNITTISNTSATLTVNNLTQTTYYRSIASGNSCAGAASSTTQLLASPLNAGSLLTAYSNLCYKNVASLTLTGYTGNIVKWQTSADGVSWIDTAVTAATFTSDSLNVGTSSYFRVEVQSATCSDSAFSNSVKVSDGDSSIASGTISLTATGCNNGGMVSGTLTLSGYTGSIIGWQYSTDSGTTWQDDLNGYTIRYSFNNISSPTQYRAILQNNACSNIVYAVYALNPVYANGNVWTGTNSTDFSDAGNWSCGNVPNSGDNITISSSAANMPLLDQDRTVGNICFETNTHIGVNGYTLTINGATFGDSTGTITGSSSSSLVLSGGLDSGILYFDHSIPGNSDLLNSFTLNKRGTVSAVTPSSPSCVPVANFGYNGDGIVNVTLGSINNTTFSQNGYTDYTTTQATSINPSSNNTVYVTTNPTGGNEQDILIWIDWNNDGVFGDGPDETIINYGGGAAGTYNFNFTAPAIGGDITTGSKTMRVYVEDDLYQLISGEAFDPCIGGFGEYEDYQIDMNYVPHYTNTKIALGNNLTIANSATFTNGILQTNNTDTLILAAASIVSGANDSSHVSGIVRKTGNTAFTFPLGNDSLYAPISISAPGNITDHFTASYFQVNPLSVYNNNVFLNGLTAVNTNEYWLLERTNGNSNVAVTVTWDSNRGSNLGQTNLLTVAHWNGSAWDNAGNTGVTGSLQSGSVTSNTVSSFSPFALGTVSSPLAVTLLNFTAVRSNQVANLAWQTTDQINNGSFDIERSINNTIWTTIGTEKTTNTSSYKFTDYAPEIGDDYYRLKMTDNDGEISYSTTRIVHFDVNQNVLIYPSPFTNYLTVDAGNSIIGDVRILDLTGRVLYHSIIAATKQTLNLDWLAAGQYTIMVNGSPFSLIKAAR